LSRSSAIEHRAPGLGEAQVLLRAVEQLLAHVALEALHGQRDGGLRAEELLGGAGEAALGHHRLEDLQGVEIHGGVYDIRKSYRPRDNY
jgi:hypothetical protein